MTGPWEKEIDGTDAVVNLAGERIVSLPARWTDERKRRLRESRISTTRNVVAAIRLASRPPAALLSGSAIGYYGSRGDEIIEESTPPGNDFLARLCVDWEAEAREAPPATRVVLLRSGVVLGPGGGGLAPLMRLFRLGGGGPWGNGKQWWSWIHLADEIGLIQLALDQAIEGPLNLCAPNPVTVNAFAKALGRALHRPVAVRAPAWALRLALGEAADPLLHLQRVVPRRALQAGYNFRFPLIAGALEDTVRPPGHPAGAAPRSPGPR